jgi:hypothetical protein
MQHFGINALLSSMKRRKHTLVDRIRTGEVIFILFPSHRTMVANKNQ